MNDCAELAMDRSNWFEVIGSQEQQSGIASAEFGRLNTVCTRCGVTRIATCYKPRQAADPQYC
jgi:hypothetical protein